MYVAWKECFTVGTPDLDEDHRTLFSMIDALQRGVDSGMTQAEIEKIMGGLVEYTDYHFTREEKKMEEAGYPGLEEHKAAHADLKARMTEYHSVFHSGGKAIEKTFIRFLTYWLEDHICGVDQKYVPYVSEAAVKEMPPIRSS